MAVVCVCYVIVTSRANFGKAEVSVNFVEDMNLQELYTEVG